MVVQTESLDSSWAQDLLEPDQITRRLSIRIVEAKTARRWSQFWQQNISLNNSVETLTANIDDLLALDSLLQGDLQKGDLIEFFQYANRRSAMSLNGTILGEFDNPLFYDFLLTAFLGSIPASNELKQRLLGLDTSDWQDDLELLDSFNYDADRANEIAGWLTLTPEPEDPTGLRTETTEDSGANLDESINPQDSKPVTDASSSPAEDTDEIDPTLTETDEWQTSVGDKHSQPSEQVEASDTEVAAEYAERPIDPEPTNPEDVSVQESDLSPEEQARLAEIEQQQEAEREAARQASLAEIAAAQTHLRSVMNKVSSFAEYPRTAIRRGMEGIVRVEITMNRDGSVAESQVVDSSEPSLLDAAALQGIEDAQPFAPIPREISDEQSILEFPIMFSLGL